MVTTSADMPPEQSHSRKRKQDTTPNKDRNKRVKISSPAVSQKTRHRNDSPALAPEGTQTRDDPRSSTGPDPRTLPPSAPSSTPGLKLRKLAPPRPFPTVPASVNATGPRSAHHEGKNFIAVTRKTALGAYLRRCKDAVVKDGWVVIRVCIFRATNPNIYARFSYRSLHLNAMGAAIPHLMLLTTSLPSVLPFDSGEIRTQVLTGTVDVQDELIPDDEDEDISYRTRGKSTLSVVMTIGDGVDEQDAQGGKWPPRGKRRSRGPLAPRAPKRKGDASASAQEAEVMDIS